VYRRAVTRDAPTGTSRRIGSIVLATNNPHKVDEIREILAPLGVAVRSLRDAGLDGAAEPTEDADTFLGNALLKARHYAALSGQACLADDSGLEVDALGGEPGVYSARYAADVVSEDSWATLDRAARDAQNNAKLLERMRDVPDDERSARFVCAMALVKQGERSGDAAPANRDASVAAEERDGDVIATASGAFEGRLAREPRGDNGFGYDPLLIVAADDDPLRGKHAAELTSAEKHERSHRGQAARAIAEAIRVNV
jgi:XTP/dITP diphosphohydrolase